MMTFSSPPTTTDPSHVLTIPQHIKTKCQKYKTFHSKPKSYVTLTNKTSPKTGMRYTHSLPWRNRHLPWSIQTFLPQENMAEISNHQKSRTALHSCSNLANCQGVPPHAPHSFHIHLCATPHIVCQHPHNITSRMLPCGICVTLLSNHVIFLSPSKSMIHVIQKPSMHSNPKTLQHCHTAHIFGPWIHHSKFVVDLQP